MQTKKNMILMFLQCKILTEVSEDKRDALKKNANVMLVGFTWYDD